MSPADDDRVVVRPLNATAFNASPLPPTFLNRTHLSDALSQSPDNGATLDLAHKGLTDIDESAAEELAVLGRQEDSAQSESPLLRLALSSNRLSTLPMAFALLSRLRYLNLKNNQFAVFPETLTMIPSLEILDISRNRLRKLPSQPGSLHNLKILSLSRNKLSKLPAYFSKFRHLTVLKIDHNPFEWPPKSIMDRASGLSDAHAMRDWIRGLQKWMEDDATKHTSHRANRGSIDGGHRDSGAWSRIPMTDRDFAAVISPHSRSFSVDSNFSVYSSASPNETYEFSVSASSLPDRPSPLTIPRATTSYSASASPTRSPDSYLPSPARSDASMDEDTTDDRPRQQHHLRIASFTGRVLRHAPLPGKKSLPDLRSAKFHFPGEKHPDLPPDRARLDLRGPTLNKTAVDDFSFPYSPRRELSLPPDGRHTVRPLRPFARDPLAVSPTTVLNGTATSMEIERNSYFRKLSTLPVSSILNTFPQSLLCLIEAARSILFAVCQVYQTLERYTVFSIDERLSSVLKKVLDPACHDMMLLISSLDRFDTMSRKAVPSPIVCRNVVESCKDTVAVFGKAVGVLALQLKVLETQDDVRYLRQMVLVLYGATAEISNAWQAMVPHLDSVKPLLRERQRPLAKPVFPSNSFSHALGYGFDHDPLSPGRHAAFSDETAPLRAVPSRGWVTSLGRSRTTRRNAGSFSSRDVEIGKKLPSYEDSPPSYGVLGGIATLSATPRVGKRLLPPLSTTQPSGVVSSPSLHLPSLAISPSGGPMARRSHSRQGSRTSLTASSSASSPSFHGPSPADVLPTSKKLVDKEALDAMKVAIEAAPGVWEMMEEILGSTQDVQADIKDILMRATIVTHRLRENINAVQQDAATADKKALRDDAHTFVKTVVQLSNIIKKHGASHTAYPALRSKMVTLTNSTEEFVILLHVSSFSPSSTPRLYMQTSTAGISSPIVSSPDDHGLASSLSRIRGRPPEDVTIKRKLTSPPRDGLREAPPPRSFNNAYYPRLGGGLPRGE